MLPIKQFKSEKFKKTQLSIEFIIIVFLVLLILVFAIIAYSSKLNELNFYKEKSSAKKIIQTLAFSVNDAYLYKSCNKTIYLSDRVDQRYNYTLSFYPEVHLLAIRWETGFYTYPIIFNQLNLTTDSKNSYIISCVDGGIKVE